MKKPSKTQVEKSLIEQLTQMGANIPFFEDRVADYMCLWDVKNGLQKDIKKRGVTYKDVSSVGVEMTKNNPSTKVVYDSILERYTLIEVGEKSLSLYDFLSKTRR